MKWENIKKGDRVLIPAVVDREPDGEYLYVSFKCGGGRNGLEYFRRADMSKYLILPPENGIKNTESASKYDPCRLFKKGDIVEPCSVNGRWCSHVWGNRSSIHYEVAKDEDPLTAQMEVKDTDSPWTFLVHAAFFKLVTPVEEIEPYRVGTGIDSQLLYCNNELFAEFEKEEEAKRVCDLLNAEHRKEMGK